MIQGVVNAAYEPVVTLTLQGPSGQSPKIEAVVDTGFSEFLTLPSVLVSEMGLSPVTRASATLADGSEAMFDVFRATLLWGGQPRNVDAYMCGTTPLVGMRLLNRHSLYIEVENGGRVCIQARE